MKKYPEIARCAAVVPFKAFTSPTTEIYENGEFIGWIERSAGMFQALHDTPGSVRPSPIGDKEVYRRNALDNLRRYHRTYTEFMNKKRGEGR